MSDRRHPVIGSAYRVGQIYRPTPRSVEQAFGPGAKIDRNDRPMIDDGFVMVVILAMLAGIVALYFAGMLS